MELKCEGEYAEHSFINGRCRRCDAPKPEEPDTLLPLLKEVREEIHCMYGLIDGEGLSVHYAEPKELLERLDKEIKRRESK